MAAPAMRHRARPSRSRGGSPSTSMTWDGRSISAAWPASRVLVRSVGTCLYGRRMYETMAVWESDATLAAQSEPMADFARVWQAANKVVYSTTLRAVSTARSRLERSFDPDSVRDMKRSATGDLTVGGANLAAHAFNGGLVDECHLFIYPVLVGGGKPALPRDTRAELELVDERRFASGVVYLRYRNSI